MENLLKKLHEKTGISPFIACIIALSLIIIAVVAVVMIVQSNTGINAYRNEYRKKIPGMLELYSDVRIDSQGSSTIVVSLYSTLNMTDDDISKSKYFDSLIKASLQPELEKMKAEPYNIKNPKIIYRVYNGNADKTLVSEIVVE
ncbi:hypothetical protein FACS1894133_1410 [Clostridia bacterium]|nr:hypothetical protein FACS1894133_1410 [Clostridia bacterium]